MVTQMAKGRESSGYPLPTPAWNRSNHTQHISYTYCHHLPATVNMPDASQTACILPTERHPFRNIFLDAKFIIQIPELLLFPLLCLSLPIPTSIPQKNTSPTIYFNLTATNVPKLTELLHNINIFTHR